MDPAASISSPREGVWATETYGSGRGHRSGVALMEEPDGCAVRGPGTMPPLHHASFTWPLEQENRKGGAGGAGGRNSRQNSHFDIRSGRDDGETLLGAQV